MTNNLLNQANIKDLFGVTSMTIWRWQRDEALAFPKPFKIRTRNYWKQAEVTDWLNSQGGAV